MADKVVIVVQARMSSSRLPGKVMLPVLGKSILFRMIERLRMISHKAQIIIATSDDKNDDIIEQEAWQMNVACYRGSLNNLLDRHYRAGLQLNAVDLRKTGRLDIIAPGKTGIYVLENQGQ